MLAAMGRKMETNGSNGKAFKQQPKFLRRDPNELLRQLDVIIGSPKGP